jgi:hypothetical protein
MLLPNYMKIINREKVDIFTDLPPYLCKKCEFFVLASYLKSKADKMDITLIQKHTGLYIEDIEPYISPQLTYNFVFSSDIRPILGNRILLSPIIPTICIGMLIM